MGVFLLTGLKNDLFHNTLLLLEYYLVSIKLTSARVRKGGDCLRQNIQMTDMRLGDAANQVHKLASLQVHFPQAIFFRCF